MLIYFISGSGDENDISVKSMNTIKQCGYLYLDINASVPSCLSQQHKDTVYFLL